MGAVPPSLVPEVRRRRRPREQLQPQRSRRWHVAPGLLALALLAAAGGGAGLVALLGWSRPAAPAAPAALTLPSAPETLTTGAPADAAAEVEAAYAALEDGRPLEARDRFLAVAARADPATRTGSALRAAAAWCELVAGRTEAAEGLLVAGLGRAGGGDTADARFLLGLSRLLRGKHAEAEKSLARAAALDPTRADVYLLWGDNLRWEGRPRESIACYRAALRRNRQETNLGFYRLKLWIAQLQAGGEPAAEAVAAIDAARRASGAPGGTVLLAEAARAVLGGRWGEAAADLRGASAVTEPAVFGVAIRDVLFAAEQARSEFREFFPTGSAAR